MLRTLAVIALSSAALSAVACKKDSSKSPGGCESGYVLSEGNVCVLQNIVDYNQCVGSVFRDRGEGRLKVIGRSHHDLPKIGANLA